MTSEIKELTQSKKEGLRQWFTGKYFDLFVWYDENGHVLGFQLCYDKAKNERVITWRVKQGFSHHIVDGEASGSAKLSPLLDLNGAFDKESLLELLKNECHMIDAEVKKFVCEKIAQSSFHPNITSFE